MEDLEKTEINKNFKLLFAYCQKLNSKIPEFNAENEKLSKRISNLERLVIGDQCISMKDAMSFLKVSTATFYRKLKFGEVRQIKRGRYRLSRELYDAIMRDRIKDKVCCMDALMFSIQGENYSYPSYVFKIKPTP